MREPWDESDLANRFRVQAETSTPRAPLNSALSRIIAGDPQLSVLLSHAPATQRLPILLLAALHFMVLSEPDHALARWYPNLTDDPLPPSSPELAPTLKSFVDERQDRIIDLVAHRRVQTNEVGRCSLLLPVFDLVAARVGQIAHLDVGTSAGLNLLAPYYTYRYDDLPPIGPAHRLDGRVGPAVELQCGTRGTPPVALGDLRVPDFGARCGIDSRPIDATDPDEARWLEACCWPDQADRFHRLRAALEIARVRPPEILAGDAVESVGPTVERLAGRGHPIVTTTFVLVYLSADRRHAFVDELDAVGSRLDLSWIFAETPIGTPELPHADDQDTEDRTALTLVTWRSGHRTVRPLATVHPHGYWIHWR